MFFFTFTINANTNVVDSNLEEKKGMECNPFDRNIKYAGL